MFSRVLRGIWENTYGLLVDDGRLAAGAILSLAITAAVAAGAGGPIEPVLGWMLFVLVGALFLANLHAAGRNARRRAS